MWLMSRTQMSSWRQLKSWHLCRYFAVGTTCIVMCKIENCESPQWHRHVANESEQQMMMLLLCPAAMDWKTKITCLFQHKYMPIIHCVLMFFKHQRSLCLCFWIKTNFLLFHLTINLHFSLYVSRYSCCPKLV